MIVDKEQIRALATQIGRAFHPQRVILFGSYAYGTPTESSDVDLLVVMPHGGSGVSQALEIVRRVRPRIPLDIVVRTPEEVDQRLAWNDFFLKEISDHGEVLFESAHA